MEKQEFKGSVTIFFSLACILFLSLICAVTESARVQGARTQSANITGMGTFSLLGEFERKLLERYELFSLDGAYGTGDFQIQKAGSRMEEFISYNANPRKDLIQAWFFDPWRLELTDSEITGYALLTDQKGEPFYQQAVGYMKANLGVIAVEELMDALQDSETVQNRQRSYEESQRENDGQITGLEGEKQKKISELESEALLEGSTAVVPVEPVNDPLREIAKLRKKSTLEIVTWDRELSDKKLSVREQPSKSRLQQGNMKIETKHSGLLSDLLFREYLLRYFPCYTDDEDGAALDYQLEYILGGKSTDQSNLKYVVNRLLLIREGMNYVYCVADSRMNSQAGSLAASLTGFLGIPALTAATKHALLLAWAYGESLIDVRILLDGGKVPLWKKESTWSLTLQNLGRVTDVLRAGADGKEEGLAYTEYLRILLYMGRITSQRMRALDLIQTELQKEKGMSGFQVNHCIVAVKAETSWNCPQVFFRLPGIVTGQSGKDAAFTQSSSMAY